MNRHEGGRRRPSRRQASEDPVPKTRLELPSRVTDPALTNTLLTALELPCEPLTAAPPRSPPQAELAWDETFPRLRVTVIRSFEATATAN